MSRRFTIARSSSFRLFLLFVSFIATIGNAEGKFWQRRKKMGQAVRMVQYDRAANERNAIAALQLAADGVPLQWFRLDDGVMGGQSETKHVVHADTGILHFCGTINTNGGGFASIRTPISAGALSAAGIKLRVRGDGKTYKVFLSDGSRAGPMARRPSWQVDVPTVKSNNENNDNDWQEVDISFDKLQPSFGPSQPSEEQKKALQFNVSEMKELGVMLSLKLSDGRPNPIETFGEGIFPFSLLIQSIEPTTASK